MSFEIEGKLHKVFATEQKSGSFQAREFVLEIASGNYPQMIKFQLTQERCALVDNYKEGDGLKVSFDLSGREWQGKYFTNLTAWRIAVADGTAAASPASSAPKAAATSAPKSFDSDFPSSEPSFVPVADNLPAMEDLPF